MRFPQVVVCAGDDWPAGQLRELAAEHRWLVRDVRSPGAARDLIRDPRPTVLLVHADPTAEHVDALKLVAEAHSTAPDVATIVLSTAKLPDDQRIAWAAAAFDLGARAVLFPPFTRSVLEDLVGGLMTATIRRVIGETPAKDDVIDLADGAYEHA